MPWDYTLDVENTDGSLSQISTIVDEVRDEVEAEGSATIVVDQFDGAALGGNLETEAGEDFLPSTVIIERDGIEIGVVGVIHTGVENENDVPNTGLEEILSSVEGFDVVFGGHMHDLVNEEINGTLVVEPDKYAEFVSRADLTFEEVDGIPQHQIKETPLAE